MKRKIKILYVTAEIAPYANAGGLGEVGRSFPRALQETGRYEVQRVMPLYKRIDKKLEYVTDMKVRMDLGYETCVIKKDPDSKELPTYFVQSDRYFYRDNIYAYEDDGFRFFLFCKAVVEMLKAIPFQPDIVHMNDWHTGFLALLLKQEFPKIKTVYTIHNISYHGFIPASYLNGLLTEEELVWLGYPEWLNFMKAGIKYADLITTVSLGYAMEILQPVNSCGMNNLLVEKADHFVGILNGIDMESYDPSRSGDLEYPYDQRSTELKKKNRTLLRTQYGLPDEDKPLLAMVTRLDYAKGLDILMKAISYLELSTFQLIILGSGNPYYQGMLGCIKTAYADKVVADFDYSADKARKIYAAADIYLMPSLYEPCGLSQLYAMRYGAVPVVNPIGGLRDTVIDESTTANSTGFYMEDWSGEALSRAIKRAIDAYHTPGWKQYMMNGMKQDFSWQHSISEYDRYYQKILL
ncbi:MAG TPA: glycogen/starch synthase [Mobilitalea sp.]|nr:glycogen/starch synthase [Mobilitalea sp.]